VVIVEAAEKGGALITAEQGRTVFAVPGPIDSPASDGAVLVRSAEGIIEELEGVRAAAVPAAPPPELDEVQRRLWEFLAEGARHSDEMAQRLGLPVSRLSGALLALEMKKLLRRLPGNRYERC
jgi:DNA processing protein